MLTLFALLTVYRLAAQDVDRDHQSDFKSIADSAAKARDANDISLAISLYRQAVRINPSWADGWWFLGVLQYGNNDYAPARDAFTRFIEINPNAAPAIALRGLCEFEVGEYQQSLTDIQRGISLGAASDPRNGGILRYREALLLAHAGNFEAALAKYDYFARQPAPQPEIVAAAGMAGLRIATLPKDIAEGDPRKPLFLAAGYAAFAFLAGDSARAGQEFQALFDRYPTAVNAHLLYGYLLFPDARQQAMQQFRQELQIAPSNTVAQAWLLAAQASETATAAQLNARPQQARQSGPSHNATYVGTAACSRCHLAIANNFAKASMGHSLAHINPEFLTTLPVHPANAIGDADAYTDPRTGHRFEVYAENGKLFQAESETDPSGKQIFRNAHAIDWIIGTGENGFGGLLNRDGYLFQGPLTFYSRASAWRLSPNYEIENMSFNRVIAPGCLSCHSGRPQPVAGTVGKYEQPPFTQVSVGCENCHGPGSEHVQARLEGDDPAIGKTRGADPTIVNPARLSSQLADDICMGCHQSGDARVLQPGKTYQDFRPGRPLDETFSIFQIQPTRENPPQDDHIEHYYSMSLSKCFRATRGQPNPLRCISCHDPHVEPSQAEAPAYFKGKCLACHTTASCTAPEQTRQQTSPSDNCIGCHMPKRSIRTVSHSTATNHRILANPGEPFPDEAFHQDTLSMPGLIHVNASGARGPNAANPPVLDRLQAFDYLHKTNLDFDPAWRRTLAEAESVSPNNAIVQSTLGHRDLQDHKLPQAIDHLSRAVQLDPEQVDAWVDLSKAQDQSGQSEQAIASARRAAELEPFSAAMQETVIFRLISAEHYDEARTAMEKFLVVFPEEDAMRKMLSAVQQQRTPGH